MPFEIRPLVHAIVTQFALPWDGCHGVGHWARVMENGLRLAAETGANAEVVTLFALFHDSRRTGEGTDAHHGRHGARYAARMRGELFQLDDADFQTLITACIGHSGHLFPSDPTVQTCWDADRLDLGRVGMVPDPRYLHTDAARSRELINWAYGRGSFDIVPECVLTDWGVDLDQRRLIPIRAVR